MDQPNLPTETQDTSDFSITTTFNNRPIRIIGSPNEPFFYASEIAAVLNLTNLTRYMDGFDTTETVSPEKRIECGIVTYRKYGDSIRKSNKVLLLTESGLYKFILSSNAPNKMSLFVHLHNTIITNKLINNNIQQHIDLFMLPQPLNISATSTFGHVYFISEVPYSGLVKIGKTRNLTNRLASLQTGNPNQLKIRKSIGTSNYHRLEVELHQELDKLRRNGEWFEVPKKELDPLINVIKDIVYSFEKSEIYY